MNDTADNEAFFVNLRALNRVAQPGELAGSVPYFASDDLSLETATASLVGGGASIKRA